MALTISISKADDLPAVEKRMVVLARAIDAAAHPETRRITEFEARLLSDWSDHLFKEQWAGMAIADGLSQADRKTVRASGLTRWPEIDDEAFQVSIPSLLSLQREADVTLANSLDAFDAEVARRYVVDRGGLLGQESGRWRCLVELDPHASVAPVLNTEIPRRDALLGLVRSILDQLEVGAYGKREPGRDLGSRRTVLEFLSELHTNGWEHARVGQSVRTVRLTKHLYLQRDSLGSPPRSPADANRVITMWLFSAASWSNCPSRLWSFSALTTSTTHTTATTLTGSSRLPRSKELGTSSWIGRYRRGGPRFTPRFAPSPTHFSLPVGRSALARSSPPIPRLATGTILNRGSRSGSTNSTRNLPPQARRSMRSRNMPAIGFGSKRQTRGSADCSRRRGSHHQKRPLAERTAASRIGSIVAERREIGRLADMSDQDERVSASGKWAERPE